ncbi:hypothetical protein TrLO_g3803 [Triparma laevis f. longispina]|uniref:Fe2OG dioxygenase domain-containing protein n=1 Tax=Triparma laevis f. longispina TaxID=1714387 RepID=A0A9W7E301_9STRA|nr:hypothetical protein TrLO_g3803 [Triparma laevis f. longispina]
MGKKSKKKSTPKQPPPPPTSSPPDTAKLMQLISTLPIRLTPSLPQPSNLLPSVLPLVLPLGETLPQNINSNLKPWLLTALKVKYALKGKEEWWMIFDDSLQTISSELHENNYCVIDDFLTWKQSRIIQKEVEEAYGKGKLPDLGVVTDGRDGSNTSSVNETVRGDYIGWFGPTKSEGWSEGGLVEYVTKLNTVLDQMKRFTSGKGLQNLVHRSRAMVTCYPPGGRYTKHVDNGGKTGNGRRLTALLYLNSSEVAGELKVYERGGEVVKEVIEPSLGRVVLFWSDERVPHEVLESCGERFCVTIWFFDGEEWEKAREGGVIPESTKLEDDEEDDEVKKNEPSLQHDPNNLVRREPATSDVTPMVVSNEPFCEKGVEPILSELKLAESKPSLDCVVEENEEEYLVKLPIPPRVADMEVECDGRVLTLTLSGFEVYEKVFEGGIEEAEVRAKVSKKKGIMTVKLPKKR